MSRHTARFAERGSCWLWMQTPDFSISLSQKPTCNLMHSQCEIDVRDIDAVLSWLEAAASLPGRSPLAVATLLANRSRSERRSGGITWTDCECEGYELTRHAFSRGLNQLEA